MTQKIETLAAIGVSAMMHGYMPFNKDGKLLVPFRTWRKNNINRRSQRELMETVQLQTFRRDGALHIFIRQS